MKILNDQPAEKLLRLENVSLHIDQVKILHDITLHINGGEMVTLLGRNGMGKTSLVQAIMGMRRVRAGQGKITFAGQEITALPSFAIARLGIGLVPEQRQIFPNLTVLENLRVAARQQVDSPAGLPWDLNAVHKLFPILRERAQQNAASLSGGEQQILAIGRALMTNPRLMILDEATEGISPIIRRQIWQCLAQLRQSGLALLVIDKNISNLLALADRHYILHKGRVVWHGTSPELRQNPELIERELGAGT
ncbi:MAG: ABC transporter ATP-binding protein [Alphaproteobacteria bacterium]|nr:ABC transporter ATP-binding protein [Alphaproteobacteria bacterium]